MENSCEITPKPKTFKELMKSWYFWKPALGVLIGGLGGFLYYYYVGCTSGSCAITGNPIASIVMGSIFGLIVVKKPCGSCC
jgi:hypothetical protein